jgi:hypothetical protein
MSRFDSPINRSIAQRPGLRQRIADLQSEAVLFVAECNPLTTMDAAAIVAQLDKAERRLRMLRHGVHIVRYEAKMIARAENHLAQIGGR